MNQILLNILAAVTTCIILPLISFLGIKLSQWLSTKIKDEKAAALFTKAVDIVTNAVRITFQTYVESLIKHYKETGKFEYYFSEENKELAKDLKTTLGIEKHLPRLKEIFSYLLSLYKEEDL